MEIFTDIILPVLSFIFASTGLWAFIGAKAEKNSARDDMLRGLAHDRIIELAQKYCERGSITSDEYENLKDYLYEPYKALGGNGTAKKWMEEVDKIKIIKGDKV